MANDERNPKRRGEDDAAARDKEGSTPDATGGSDAPVRRHGIPGKGFDAGTGYGGAGGDSAYDGESSYGGQAGYGGSTTRGAYSGGKFGRPDDPGGAFGGRGEPAPDEGTADADATGDASPNDR
ncbi:MAG TPA: hypothetical protein VFJ74_14990 [Gemmatimonadaceae bacterium]|nr:hypothetical protein [Gemmatimonadaceae bacterium]